MVATYFSSFLAAITIGHEQRNLIETFSSNVSLEAEARAVSNNALCSSFGVGLSSIARYMPSTYTCSSIYKNTCILIGPRCDRGYFERVPTFL